MTIRCPILLVGAVLVSTAAAASAANPTVSIAMRADAANPPHPTMGDRLRFHSTITNTGRAPLEGMVAWISLIEIDPGNEQPVDLEDWSAHKAVTAAKLSPGDSLTTEWPMRLIKSGDYRVLISVAGRNQRIVHTSGPVDFHVTQKPVVKSSRILPVAFGVPLFLIGAICYRWMTARGRRRTRQPERTFEGQP